MGVRIEVTYPNGKSQTFESISEAARSIGINRQEIHRYLRGEYKSNRKGYKFRTIFK